MKRARLLFYLNNADGELSNEDAFILRDSGFVQQIVQAEILTGLPPLRLTKKDMLFSISILVQGGVPLNSALALPSGYRYLRSGI